MSTKKRQANSTKLTFLEFLEKELKLTSLEVYQRLGWDRRSYFSQKKREGFPFPYLEDLRFAVGLTEIKFYSLVRRFLNGD